MREGALVTEADPIWREIVGWWTANGARAELRAKRPGANEESSTCERDITSVRSSDVDEPIILVEPDPGWAELYRAEADRARAVLGSAATAIEHVGSTAVPLLGKPVVDLLIGVQSLEIGRAMTPQLVALGYEDFGDIFIPGRLYLRRRGPPHFNVAIAQEGGPFFSSQLAVRDYLRAHPDDAKAYAAEKRRAYAHGARLFSTYSQEKNEFVTSLIKKATEWAREKHDHAELSASKGAG